MAAQGNQIQPGMFDMRAVYRRVLGQLKVPAIDEVLPNPLGAKESNPALENVGMTMNRPAAAYPDQDHLAHIRIHLDYANNPAYGGNPVIGPMFAPHALEHIKQHLTLHYLQSMRAYVAKAAGGQDAFQLNQEKPLSAQGQQALAIASEMVNQDSQQQMQEYVQQIQALAQKVQQANQQKQESASMADPTAQVILKTQMAETQRKTQEAQAKMQLESQKDKQEYELKVAQLQQKIQELQAKYSTQTDIDNQRNATDIAMANINNAAKERVAMIAAGAQLDQHQRQLEHEQNMSAMQAISASEQDIRQHGIAVQQQAFQQQAEQVAAQAAHEQQMAQQGAQAQNQVAQTGLEHAIAMKQAEQQQQATPTPTTGA
jgi:hypothetical protein